MMKKIIGLVNCKNKNKNLNKTFFAFFKFFHFLNDEIYCLNNIKI